MKTITKPIYVVAYHFAWMEAAQISFDISAYKPDIGDGVVGFWEHSITLPEPEDFDPFAAQIVALEAERLAAVAAYQKTVANINERLAKLQAITNEVDA